MKIQLKATKQGMEVVHNLNLDIVPRVGERIQIVGDGIGSYEVREVAYLVPEDRDRCSVIIKGMHNPNKEIY